MLAERKGVAAIEALSVWCQLYYALFLEVWYTCSFYELQLELYRLSPFKEQTYSF